MIGDNQLNELIGLRNEHMREVVVLLNNESQKQRLFFWLSFHAEFQEEMSQIYEQLKR